MNSSSHTPSAQIQAKNAAATKPNTVATIAFPTLPPFTAAFDSVAAAAFCAVPDALCAAELVADNNEGVVAAADEEFVELNESWDIFNDSSPYTPLAFALLPVLA